VLLAEYLFLIRFTSVCLILFFADK
jgi:hypothetical protein